MHASTVAERHRQAEHLVEVAIVHIATPVDGNQVPAHHAIKVGIVMCVLQQAEVSIEFACFNERRAKPLNRHIGENKQLVEDDAILLAEHPPIIDFERSLRGRKRWSLRIVYEVEHELGVAPITDRVETLKTADRAIENTLSALPVNIGFQVARHRRDHFDTFARQELCKILLTRLRKYCEIAAVHNLGAELASFAHELAEMPGELG